MNIKPKDVVRISSYQFHEIVAGKSVVGRTGVVNRIDSKTGMVNVFLKNAYHGVWFFKEELKKIGRVP